MQGGVLVSSARTFDISNESDIVALLKTVRHSTLDAETKDDIRDVVFELQNHQDQSLLSELQLYVEPLSVSVTHGTDSGVASGPVIDQLSATPQQPSNGRIRPVPVFKSAVSTQPLPAPEEVKATPPEPEPVLTPPPASPTVAPGTKEWTIEAADSRLKAIKADVNRRIGNPVNLIDINNTVGREYMTSLLEVMKQTATGINPSVAMERLEAAYTAVQNVLNEGPKVASEATLPTVAPEVVMEPVAPLPVPKEPEPLVAPAPVTVDIPPEPLIKESIEIPKLPTSVPPDSGARKVPLRSVAEVDLPHTGASAPKSNTLNVAESPSSAKYVPSTPPQPTDRSSLRSMASVGSKVYEPAAVKPVEPDDPLMSSVISSGLTQLLSEWKLFKSNGFFGTGPSGSDHPLYLELRNLKMSSVISGRFEGATPDVRQSITDYMNGWRYEQGVTHDINETFEHYLRRVIRVIIDTQNSGS